jgi:hypothetical protein
MSIEYHLWHLCGTVHLLCQASPMSGDPLAARSAAGPEPPAPAPVPVPELAPVALEEPHNVDSLSELVAQPILASDPTGEPDSVRSAVRVLPSGGGETSAAKEQLPEVCL